MINPFEKLIYPEKHSQKIEIKNIVAAPKLHREGVDRYKKQILAGKNVKPIVVLKHPDREVYAVLDGHHRFYAFLELGYKRIDAAVIKSNKLLFNTAKDGWLQPTPEMTRFIHVPALAFKKYVNDFVKNPKKHIRYSKKSFVKLKSKISSLKKKGKMQEIKLKL